MEGVGKPAEGKPGEAKPEAVKAPEKAPKKKLTKAEKQGQHMDRLRRTAVACFAGILAGVIAFLVDRNPPTGTAIGILLLLAAIVFQKYVFLALRMDYLDMTAKDWVFQGFMTFCFWFITWTILLTSAQAT